MSQKIVIWSVRQQLPSNRDKLQELDKLCLCKSHLAVFPIMSRILKVAKQAVQRTPSGIEAIHTSRQFSANKSDFVLPGK